MPDGLSAAHVSDRAVTAAGVGFGCASLGSRIGATEGRRALERALAAGITWFDVAPAYGDGQAERILGAFAAAHPGAITITSKVGLAPRPMGWRGALRPLARSAVAMLPQLRGLAATGRVPARLPLGPETLRQSVGASLAALRGAPIDRLMLHDPDPADVTRPDLLACLTDLLREGRVGAVGVAGSTAAAAAAVVLGAPYSLVQIASSPFDPAALARLAALVARPDTGLRAALAAAGYDDGPPRTAAAAFLTDYALAANRGGICLFSACAPHHLEALAARMAAPRRLADLMPVLDRLNLMSATGTTP
ncbi:aldo/keto reductase [Phaeovulum veldkampii]|uniref:aldo/keto reductase n=1 Tax=Phaeovulum veldkampii TaxID=33049 RepID=UPI0019149B1F|nr:aldo/keto reductase [Phaeovulum veldkampii]